jgi:hypothetical protein
MGRKTQQQTTAGNCPDSVKTRKVDCPYVGPWVKIGGCGADGKQYYRRDVVNSGADRNKSENCCYNGAWNPWDGWGACNGSTRSRTRTRSVVNCPAGTATTDTENQGCNHCQGAWGGWGGWGAWEGSGGCWSKRTAYRYRTYFITKNASNGGKACPHKDRETQRDSKTRTVRCH